LEEFEVLQLDKYYKLKYSRPGAFDPLTPIQNRHPTISSLITLNIDACLHFKCRDIDKLTGIFAGFGFLPQFNNHGYSFSGEEVFFLLETLDFIALTF